MVHVLLKPTVSPLFFFLLFFYLIYLIHRDGYSSEVSHGCSILYWKELPKSIFFPGSCYDISFRALRSLWAWMESHFEMIYFCAFMTFNYTSFTMRYIIMDSNFDIFKNSGIYKLKSIILLHLHKTSVNCCLGIFSRILYCVNATQYWDCIWRFQSTPFFLFQSFHSAFKIFTYMHSKI